MRHAGFFLIPLLALAAPAEVIGTFAVTGQVTSVFSYVHTLRTSGDGRALCINGGGVRSGDLVVETVHLATLEHGRTSLEQQSVAVLGRSEPPPPRDITLEELVRERPFSMLVRTEGVVEDFLQEETALDSYLLTLRSGSSRLQVTVVSEDRSHISGFDRMLNARIVLTGVYFDHINSDRPFHGPVFVLTDRGSIRIVDTPRTDLFQQPSFDPDEATSPDAIVALPLRTLTGTVLACWDRQYALLKSRYGLHRLALAFGTPPPAVGSRIEIVGQPETDCYHINFSSVRHRPAADAPSEKENARESVCEGLPFIFRHDRGKTLYRERAFGKIIHLRGTLTSRSGPLLNLLVDGSPVNVDAGVCPDTAAALRTGSVLDATGLCILDIDNWRPGSFLPPIKGYRLVLRSAADLTVFRTPSWWTPARFVTVIACLFALLVGALVWVRTLNRLVIRRSHELLRERSAHLASELRIGERTRLAVELHDSLSQNLTGVTFQIASAQNALGAADGTAKERLATAERILKSCHAELRNVLSDLRSSALEERDFANAIRMVLKNLLDRATADIRFNVLRSHIPDSTAHALLCIIRELAANAIRHGGATHLEITGTIDRGTLTCTVRENGRGFDPAHRPGPGEGHFGLDGIRTRVRHLNGTFALTSTPGHGSLAVLTLPTST